MQIKIIFEIPGVVVPVILVATSTFHTHINRSQRVALSHLHKTDFKEKSVIQELLVFDR